MRTIVNILREEMLPELQVEASTYMSEAKQAKPQGAHVRMEHVQWLSVLLPVWLQGLILIE